MSRLWLCVDELGRHLREHRGAVALAVMTMALAFFLLGLFLLVLVNVQAMTGAVTEDLKIRVYLQDGVDPAQRETLQARLEREPMVAAVSYVSKDEALSRLREQLKDQAVLLEGLGMNPLPAAYEIRLRQDPAALAELPVFAGRLQGWPGVEHVQYGQEWMERFRIILTFLRALGLGVGALVSVAVVAIVAGVIRFLIDARRDDIEVFKVVGASPTMIAVPYLLEGLLLGAVSAAVAIGLLVGVVQGFGPTLEAMSGFLFSRGGLRFMPVEVIISFLVGGAVLGGVGSLISLRRSFWSVSM